MSGDAFCTGCGKSLARSGNEPSALISQGGEDATTASDASISVERTQVLHSPTPAPSKASYESAEVGSRFIGRWNWGAAFLYEFWLMTHRHFLTGLFWIIFWLIGLPVISVLVEFGLAGKHGVVSSDVTPLLNLVYFCISVGAFIFYGTQGNRIAVKSGRYSLSTEETFIAVQKAWTRWAIGLCVALPAFAFLAFLPIEILKVLGSKAH